jgi:hypothetical protein
LRNVGSDRRGQEIVERSAFRMSIIVHT